MKIPAPYLRKRARIEIIPLIDIIFFLLATFVMVSLSMVKNQGISVNLPTAALGTPLDRSLSKIITVTKEGDVYLDKERMSVERVCDLLKDLRAQNPEIKIIINGDEEADFGQAVHLLDEIRKIGIHKVSIQTKGSY